MDIYKILELNYQDQQWAIGEDYDSLAWDENNSIPKPSKADLQRLWDSDEFKVRLQNSDMGFRRRTEILSEWPIHAQFEALTELHMNRPEKMNELMSFISEVKRKYPKSQTP